MVASFNKSQPPNSVRETIPWLLELGRPPLPECPIEAAKQGKEPKAPCYFDGRRVVTISWKEYQKQQPIPEIFNAWFTNPKTGIGTLGGWNGKHWLGWIDLDQKDFVSSQECDRAIAVWLEQYPVMVQAPMFRTPSGGYRFLVAFNREPENFKANSGFSLKEDGSHHVGELLSKNGGHTLLPPTIGTNGKAYCWERWNEYPPVVDQPEDVGLYPVQKRTKTKLAVTPRGKTEDTSLTALLEREIYPRLTSEQAFNWGGHDFKTFGDKLKGNCPWHESQSGTAFYVDFKDGLWLWRCPACDIGGGVIEYRHRLRGGDGSPRGKDFVDIVRELADEVGVTFPSNPYSNEQSASSKGDRTHTGKSGSDSGNSKVVNHPAFTRLTVEELTQPLDRLIEQGLTQLQLEAAISSVAKQSGYTEQVAWKLYQERLKEVEQAENRDDIAEQVRRLLEAKEESLDISTILPDTLATPIKQLAAWLNLRPECYLTALLATVSSLHDVGTHLTLLEKTDFDVTPNLFAAIVAESSQKKSPIFKAMVTKPLGVIRDAARLEYEQAMLVHNQAMEQYNALKLKGDEKRKTFPDGPPKEPKLRVHSFTHTTGEGILAQVNAHPNKGLLWETDELAAALKSANSYRQGRGSDEEDLLSFYDGTGATVLRAGGIRADLRGLLLSIIGTIQPGVLEKLAGDCNDINGKWARFAFVHQPLAACEILDDSGSLNLTPMLADLYQKIDELPSVAYKLSPDAKRYFLDCRNKIDKRRVNDPNPAIRAVWGKTEGRIGKIAINLHVIWELVAGRTPSRVISKDVIVAAARLAKFYANQIQSLYFQFTTSGNYLPPNLVKVVELSRRKGWLKSKDVQLSINAKNRPSPDTVRGWFHELVAMGEGQIRGQGRSIEFSVNPVDLGRPEVDVGSTAESASVIEPQPKVDKVDLVDPNRSDIKLITAQTITDSVDQESTRLTKVDSGSTSSTCLLNIQNSGAVKARAVDHPSTFGSTLSTLESVKASADAIAPSQKQQLQPAPTEAIALQEASEPTKEEWLSPENLQEMAELLSTCTTAEEIAELRQIWPDYALRLAGQLLDAESRERIKALVVELNAQAISQNPAPRTELKTGMWVRCADDFYGHLGAQVQDGRWWVVAPKTRKVDAESRLYAATHIIPMPTQ